MLLRNKVKELEKNVEGSFRSVSLDMDSIIAELDSLGDRLAELKKDNKALSNALAGLRGHVDDEFYDLGRSGMATSVSKLNDEVFKKRKESLSVSGWSYALSEEPTLAGKVDAIIEHLGIDVEVKPEEKKEAKVVAKKVTKKKGKK